MAIGKEGIELFENVRKLIDHSQCADMATKYHAGKFNHANVGRLLHDYLRVNATDEEIKEIYPRGL